MRQTRVHHTQVAEPGQPLWCRGLPGVLDDGHKPANTNIQVQIPNLAQKFSLLIAGLVFCRFDTVSRAILFCYLGSS